MTQIQTLYAVLRHAESERDEAQTAMHRAKATAEGARLQLEQLLSYREQYDERWSGQFAQGSGIDIVHCYQSFTTRLSQAIQQQRRVVQQYEAQLQQATSSYRSRELRVAAIGKLIERRTNELALAASRRERKHSDESSAQSARRGSGAMQATG